MEMDVEVESESSPDHGEVALFSAIACPRDCVEIDLGGEQDWEVSHIC